MFINNILKAIILLVFCFLFLTGLDIGVYEQQKNRWKKIMLIQKNLNINETQFTVYGIMSCLLTEDINRSHFYTFKITGKVPCLHMLTRHLTHPKYLSVTLKSDLKGEWMLTPGQLGSQAAVSVSTCSCFQSTIIMVITLKSLCCWLCVQP